MDIPALSMALAQSQLQTNIGTTLLGKELEQSSTMGDSLNKMLELSVNPDIGSNIDISL